MIKSLIPFWKTEARYRVLYGGRGSGKSYSTAQHAIMISTKRKLKILCIRQYQNNIKESVYTLLKDIIYSFNMQDDFEILSNTIRHKHTKSEFIFYGIARNFMEIKSTEGVDVCWIEEAHALSKEQWDVINPTIRKDYSEMWLIFNPDNRSDFVWQRFVEHPHNDSVIKKINYDENKYLSNTMKKVIEEAKEEDLENYEHIFLGKPKEGDDRALFTYDEIEQAMDGDLSNCDKSGTFSYAVDVARYGSDKSVLTKKRGYHIYVLEEFTKYSTMELANTVSNRYEREQKEKPNGIFVDTIGVGAGVFDRLEERGYRTIDANASMKADESDTYINKRAEMYFLLKEFIKKGGKIPNDDDLKEELLAIRYFYSKLNGKIQIQSKDEIKDILKRSPDKSDSVALHFFSTISTTNVNVMQIQKNNFKKRNRR